MTLEQLLTRISDLGIRLSAREGSLVVKAPAGHLPEELQAQLIAHKPALLALLPEAAAPASMPDGHSWPPVASRNQERLWFLHQLEGGNAYNMALVIHFNGRLDRAALCRALAELVDRHETLRTVFGDRDGGCVPRLLPPSRFQVGFETLEADALAARVRALADRPFDLSAELPIAAVLFELSPSQAALGLFLHHIAVDGLSVQVLLDELGARYRGEILPPVQLAYSAWARMERERDDNDRSNAGLAWWAGYLKELVPNLNLPMGPLPAATATAGPAGHIVRPPDPALARLLDDGARRLRVTPFTLMTAAFGASLAQHTNQDRIALGIPVANRTQAGTHRLVGFLANTLALRCDISDNPSFAALVRRVSADTAELLSRQDAAIDRLVGELGLPRLRGAPSLFQAMIASQPRAAFALDGLECRVTSPASSTAKFPLTLLVTHHADGIGLDLEYQSSWIEERLAAGLLQRFRQMLASGLREPNCPVKDHPPFAEPHAPRSLDLADAGTDAATWQNGFAGRVAAGAAARIIDDQGPRPPVMNASELAQPIARIWCDVLHVDAVQPDDDFFDLGGHSLLAARLCGRVRRELGINVPLKAIFYFPSLAGFTAFLAQEVPTSDDRDRAGIAASIDLTLPHVLSHAQEHFWILEHLEEPSAQFNIGMALRIFGAVNTVALAAAVRDIGERHQVLAVRVFSTPDGPRQVVDRKFMPELSLHDIGAEATEAAVRSILDSRFAFGLEPLARIGLFRLADAEHILAVCFHHAVGDGWSIGVFNHDLALAYQARRAGRKPEWPALPVGYGDFAVWQRRSLERGTGPSAHRDYWLRQLEGIPDTCTLPADFARPERTSHVGAQMPFKLDGGTTATLHRVARASEASLFMVLLAAFAVVLARMRGDPDVVIGSPFSGRTRPELEPIVGCFVNPLVLRFNVDHQSSFLTLLEQVKATVLAAHEHQEMPFGQLVDALKPARSAAYSPLFQVLFVMDPPALRPLDLPDLEVQPCLRSAANAKYDLNVHFKVNTGADIEGYLEYATDLFEPQTIERLKDCLTFVLDHLHQALDRPVRDLPILSPALQVVLSRLSRPRNPAIVPTGGLVHEMFAEQARRTPHLVALEIGERTISYLELAVQVNRIARSLRALGAAPDMPVAVLMRRSAERVAVLLGILSAGAAYLPLDVETPAARNKSILEDSQCRILAIDTTSVPVTLGFGGQVLFAEELDRPIVPPVTEPDSGVRSHHLAYILYTSGTTGSPKGVMVPHHGVAHDLRFLIDSQNVSPGDRVLQVTEYCFDPSVRDLFATLASGATAVLLTHDDARNPAAILRKIHSGRITRIFSMTPTVLRAMLPAAEPLARASVLRTLMLNGEALTAADVQTARRHFGSGVTIVNQYGPTEATMTSCIHEVTTGDLRRVRIPVGHPNPGTCIHILDEAMQPLPPGFFGEVYIGGTGVARGYLGRPELTAKSFPTRRLADDGGGDRLFRTGDIGRWLPDGALDLLGRIDSQVKIRGNRVELPEIEACLGRHPLIRQTAASVWTDPRGIEHLMAYVVVTERPSGLAAILRNHVAVSLPPYMVPAFYLSVDSIPRKPSGKIDVKRLPVPNAEQVQDQATSRVTPATNTERKVNGLWQDVLGTPDVGVHTNFFDLGGNSLLLVRLHELLNRAFGRDDAVIELFRYPTIAEYSAFIDGATARLAPHAAGLRLDRIGRRRAHTRSNRRLV
jgi:amino acid adenylation domain-containing protein